MELQEHYNRYNHNKELQDHLKEMVEFLKEKFNSRLQLSEGSISFYMPRGDKWAWINTYDAGDRYDLLLKNRYYNEHEMDSLDLEDNSGIRISTRNKKCPRLYITEEFNIHQPSFKSFLEERFEKYKKHKEARKSDAMRRGNYHDNKSGTNYWIFQLEDSDFKDLNELKSKDAWPVNQHKNDIKDGDKALLYISGEKEGFYGTADITSDIFEEGGNDYCEIELEYLFLDDPILKDKIINNPVLRDSRAGEPGTNFRAGKEEYDQLLSIYYEQKMPESNYKNFNGYDLELLKIGFEEYLRFKKEKPEREEYKFNILEELNQKLSINEINTDNLLDLVDTLKKSNPNTGSFVHWSNIDNLNNFASAKPAEVVELIQNLFDDNQKLSARIDEFLERAKEFQSDISLGTPFFGYLMCAFDRENYIIYKDKTFQRFCKWFGLNVPFSIGEKYEYYISICNELLDFARKNIDEDMVLLNMQDFIYTITRYPDTRFRTSLRYIQKLMAGDYILAGKEKPRVNNLLQDIHDQLSNNENMKDIDFAGIKYKKGQQQMPDEFKCFLPLYPAEKSSYRNAASLYLAVNQDNQIEYGLYPGELLDYSGETEEEKVNIEDIHYDYVINKYTELLADYKELNSEEESEDEIITDNENEIEEKEEEQKISLPVVNFDRELKLEDLYFPDEERLLKQISIALRNGKNIILIGPPGTGKSKLAKVISSQYIGEDNYSMTTATSDWSTFETIGGYQPDNNNMLSFKRGLFLDCFKYGDEGYPANRWLIVDEINRADIDKAFGSLFSALTGDSITLNYKSPGNRNIVVRPQEEGENLSANDFEYVIPTGWRMIATMNTFDKTSLYEMSYAFMRRFAFIPVNVPLHIDSYLINKYLDCWNITDKRFVEDTVRLWKTINDYRKIGPALVEDIYKYLIESDGDYSSAVIMYLFPQLEGMMEDRLIQLLKELYQFDETGMIRNFALEYFGLERISDEI